MQSNQTAKHKALAKALCTNTVQKLHTPTTAKTTASGESHWAARLAYALQSIAWPHYTPSAPQVVLQTTVCRSLTNSINIH